MVKWLLVLVVAAAGACTLFDDDPPDDSCTSDIDCFRAQGETCNTQTHKCEVKSSTMDAGVDTP
ncbi:MAG TPA: hypothetical protein VIV40_09600 [Kofleriaceae bacterium]